MLKTHGMHSYVLNNNLKSLALLAGFLVVVQLMFAAIWAATALFISRFNGFSEYMNFVLSMSWRHAPSVGAGSLVWAFLAFLYYKHIVRGMTGLHEVSRLQEPRLYTIVENLSIATGLTTPRIEVSETLVMNAFALGLSPGSSTIGVTRGLLNGLNDDELESVIAHELTHVRTLDVRLMTFATILCGIIFSIGWFLTYRVREWSRQSKTRPLILLPIGIWLYSLHLVFNNGLAWQAIGLTAALIMSALFIGLCLRFSISRNREFVADLGACELTKKPEALITALVKIHGRNLIPHCDPTVQAMMISAPSEGLFASHPDIEERINAIVSYAATHLNGLRLAPAASRYIPTVNTAAVNSAFSITKMKYPAWVSKPLIVVPSLLVGVLVSVSSQMGAAPFIEFLANAPSTLQSVAEAPLPNATFRSDELRGTIDSYKFEEFSYLSFFRDMGLGDWKILLTYFLIGLAITFGARFMRSFGFDSDLLRSMAGAPSKEMQSDWDEQPVHQATQVHISPNMTKLEAAMHHAIAAQSQISAQTYQHHSSQPPQTRAVFGKR